MIDHGKVIAEGTPGQLKASVGSGALHVRLLDPEQRPEAEQVLRRELGAVTLEPDPAALSASCADADRGAEAVAELTALGRADRRLLARPAEPRRGLPRPDRPPRRGGRRAEPAPSTRSEQHEHRPDDPDHQRTGRRRGRGPQGDRLDLPPAPGQRALGRAHLRLARDAEGQARPRAAARRDDHAGDVRAHVHLPVRRRDRRVDRRVPGLHPPRDPGDVGAVHHRLLGGRAEHRPDQGRRRPLPLAADLAAGAAASGRCSATACATWSPAP